VVPGAIALTVLRPFDRGDADHMLIQPWERDRAVRRGETDDRARPACADQVAAHLLAHEEGMVPPTRSTEIGGRRIVQLPARQPSAPYRGRADGGSRQLGEECRRLFEIGGVEALGERAVDGREQVQRLARPALLAP
jgi:hypothetical protein